MTRGLGNGGTFFFCLCVWVGGCWARGRRGRELAGLAGALETLPVGEAVGRRASSIVGLHHTIHLHQDPSRSVLVFLLFLFFFFFFSLPPYFFGGGDGAILSTPSL